MREVKKEKKVKVVSTDMECEGWNRISRFTTTIESDDILSANGELTIVVTELEPETLSEFRRENDLTKDELLNWLNENYK